MRKALIILLSIALFAYACADIVEQPHDEKDKLVPDTADQQLKDTQPQQQPQQQHDKHHISKNKKHHDAKHHSEATKVQAGDNVPKVDSDEVHASRQHRPVKGQKGEHKSHRSRKVANRNKHRRQHGQHGEKQHQRKSKQMRQQTVGKPKNRSHNVKRNRHHSH